MGKSVKETTGTKKIVMNTYMGMMLRIVNLVTQFVFRTVMLKVLGDQYIGVSGLFSSILMMLSLTELGIGSAITFALYRPMRERDMKKIAALMNFYKAAYHVVALAVMGIGLLILPLLPYIVKEVPDIKESIYVIYLFYLVQSASSYLWIYKSVLLNVDQKNYVIAKIDIVVNILKTGISIVIITVFHNFLLYLAIEVGLTIIRNIIVSRRAGKNVEGLQQYKNEHLTPEEKSSLWKDVMALSLYSASNVVLASTDNIVISALLGTTLVTYVGNYKTLINAVDGFVWQFYGALNPGIGNYAVDHTREEQRSMFLNVQFTAYIFSSICFTAFMVVLYPFIAEIWLEERYVLSQWITVLLALDFYLNNMLRVVSVFRNANGLFVEGKYRPLFMAVLNIILSFWLGKIWGIAGVIAATVLSRLVTQCWFDPYIVYKYVFQRKMWEYLRINAVYLLVTAVNTVLTIGICMFLPQMHGVLHFLVNGMIAVAVSTVSIWICFRKSSQWQYLAEKAKAVVKR